MASKAEEQRSLEASIISLFSLKADTSRVDKLRNECVENYLPRVKGTDMLYRVCNLEDQLKSLMLV